MRNRSRLLLAVPGVVLATGWPQPAGAASFRLSRWSEFTFSARTSSPPQDGALTPAARRFSWTGWRPFDDPAVRGQANVSQFARHVHFQRFRLLALNGTTPFPLAAFELGSKNRFGNRLAIDAGVFRYRYGGYRLTLPVARGYSGSAGVLPSLGMSSRTTGAELQAGYKLASQDYAGLNASYTHARRSSLPTLEAGNRQITNVSSFQIVPSYEHILPLAHGRSLTFEAAAIYRSSVRLLTRTSPIGSSDPSVRKIETTRFDGSLTYRSSPRFSVTAFVRNITDVRPDRSATLTTRNVVNPTTVSAVLSEPRTFGLSLSARL